MAGNGLALIIGGANGIGAACCEAMKREGWSILVADKDIEAGRKTAARLGGQAFAFDISDVAAIEALEQQIDRDVGPLEALVVSSGVFQANQPIEQTPPDLFDTIMAVNVRGAYHANRIFGIAMARRGRGVIVNVASITGLGGTPSNIYGPGKAALINLTKSLAAEFGGRGVRVNSVSPGITLVPRIKERIEQGSRYADNLLDQMALRRLVEPSEVGEVVEFLASRRASAITGTDVLVDCGWMAGSLWQAYVGGMR
jgi:NAD(P)-dependent dehydrogenase (short-subunit alcohol dehydrogenase family)